MYINNKIVYENAEAKVISISICLSSIILILDAEELKFPVIKSYREKGVGNMLSFSYDGVLLWKADDILKDHHFPFAGGRILSEADKASYTKWHGILFDEKHEYFEALTFADEHYIIDVTKNRFITRVVSRG